MTRRTLILRYALFAVIATIGNLAIQRGVMSFGESAPYFIAAVALGTFVGLVIKYVLDKQWIFLDQSTGVKAHSRKFMLYTSMGLVTTAIFWGTETAFWLIWGTDSMREMGAILGLSVGYVVKYDLDRRFVFDNPALSNAA